MTTLYDFTMRSLDGAQLPLRAFEGKAVLVVNVASQCGYTPQYRGLQALSEALKGDGLVVLGVPANEFGAQEPGTDAEIKGFCETNYGVTFPMTSKVVVKGEGQHPLYAWLKSQPGGAGKIEWNFAKFLVGRDGKLIKRYSASFLNGAASEQAQLDADIAAALAK